MASTHSFVQVNGQLYVGTTGVVASALVTSANKLAEFDGDFGVEISFEQISNNWRKRVVQDRDTIAINGVCNVGGLQFRASTLSKLMSNVTTGSSFLYGGTTGASAIYWEVRSSTAPKTVQLCFEFTNSYDNKKFQFWTRVQTGNFPMPFTVNDYTKQDLTFNMIASTDGGGFFKILKSLH